MTHLTHLLTQLNIVACSTTLAIPKGKADVALADNLHIAHRPSLTAKSSPIGLKVYHLQPILAGILLGQTIGSSSSSRNDGLNGVKLLVGEFTLNKFAHQIIVLKCATTYYRNFHSLLFFKSSILNGIFTFHSYPLLSAVIPPKITEKHLLCRRNTELCAVLTIGFLNIFEKTKILGIDIV